MKKGAKIFFFHFLKAKSCKNLFCFKRKFLLLFRSEEPRLRIACDESIPKKKFPSQSFPLFLLKTKRHPIYHYPSKNITQSNYHFGVAGRRPQKVRTTSFSDIWRWTFVGKAKAWGWFLWSLFLCFFLLENQKKEKGNIRS